MIGARREPGNKATFLELCLFGKMHAEMLHASTYHNVVESVGHDPVAVGEMVDVVLYCLLQNDRVELVAWWLLCIPDMACYSPEC